MPQLGLFLNLALEESQVLKFIEIILNFLFDKFLSIETLIKFLLSIFGPSEIIFNFPYLQNK